jgi:histidinol dehydrogenase
MLGLAKKRASRSRETTGRSPTSHLNRESDRSLRFNCRGRILAAAAQLSNEFAPEHLQLEVADPWALLEKIRHAGAIFLGYSTPEAVG